MTPRVIKYVFAAIVLCISSAACSEGNAIVIFLDIDNGNSVVYQDGVKVQYEDMYSKFAMSLSERGRETSIEFIFDSSAAFSEVINIKGVLQAVGFSNINYYYLSEDQKKMAELKMIGPAIMVPYTIK